MTEPTDSLELLKLLEQQPSLQSWIWQANQLAVSRYQLGEMEQKLLLYSIAMIDGKDAAFARYRVHVATYAEACGIGTKALYTQLRAAAESIAAKPLLVVGHRAEDGKTVDLLTHWFSEVEFGEGYIDVTFPRSLKPYLLGVKSDFYKFELAIPLHLSGEYAIRLYQFCKRWKFTGHSKTIQVSDLRVTLGLIEIDQKGKPIKERLPKYGDMKKWALLPALAEIARASDILVRMKERKRPGTKLVEVIEFTILDNPAYKPVPGVPKLKAAQVTVDPAISKLTNDLQEEFGLSAAQARKAIAKHGVEYVQGKAEVVRAKPQKNAAAALLAALRDDWKAPKKTRGVAAKKAAPAPLPEPVPVLTPEEEERARGEAKRLAAEFKASMKGGPRQSENQGEFALSSTAA